MATNKAQSNQNNHNLLSRFMPMAHWAPNYERGWLRFDLIAGITVPACAGWPFALALRIKWLLGRVSSAPQAGGIVIGSITKTW